MKYRILFFIALSSNFLLHAQVDTKGTDFWLAFGRLSSNLMQIRVVGSDQPATGSIYFTALGTSVPFSVNAGQVFTYDLSSNERTYVSNTATGTRNYSVHITSTAPVTAYALNQQAATTDATNILPTPVLGTDYYQISYTPANTDIFIVVATENNTQVLYNNALVATLNTGQVYSRASGTDMTGDHITSDKPIAFFAANQGVNLPAGYLYQDILFQQLAPVNTWGKNFFVPVSRLTKDIIRIVASQNGTNITQTGGTLLASPGAQTTLTNLQAGQWVELVVYLSNNGCFIQADKPVGICTFLTCGSYNGFGYSDPSQAWLPSVEQSVSSALIAPFIPFGNTQLTAHYALIITPTATKNNTTVSIGAAPEQPLSGGTWYDNATAGMSFYEMQLSSSTQSYLYSNPTGGLFVMGYATGSAESYYYLASSAMRTLDASFYVNDIHNQDLQFEAICTQPIVFRAEIFGDMSSNPGYLKWYIDNVEVTAYRDFFTWDTILPSSSYQIKMEVLMDDDVTVKTVEGTLMVASLTAPPITPSGVVNVCPPDTYLQLSTVGDSCRWYHNGTPIIGETSNVYNATVSGEYSVMILYHDCNTAMSDTVTVLIGGFVQAYNDTVQTLVNTPALVAVLDNDSLGCCGSGGGLIGPVIVAGEDVKHGVATFVNDTLYYIPDAGFIGMDSLIYYIKCGTDSTAAKVLFEVQCFYPDVMPVESTSSAVLDDDSILFTLTITNLGDASIGPPVHYTLYKESVPTGYIMNDSAQVQINKGSTTTITFKVAISSIQPAYRLIVRINDKNGVFPFEPECDDTNNVIEFINPALHLLMRKDAILLPSYAHNGSLANPVSVLFSDSIAYEITAVNVSHSAGNVIIRDTLPIYLKHVFGSVETVTPVAPADIVIDTGAIAGTFSRDTIRWLFSNVPSMDSRTVRFIATPLPGAVASQPMFENHAWIQTADTIIPTNDTWHQGADVSRVTFSAGFGGNIYNATEQALDYRTTPRSGIVIVPDEGYRFAGWSHADYLSLRGNLITAQSGIMLYDTLTVYGDVELHANFDPEQYPITYHLNGGHFPSVIARDAPPVIARDEAIYSQFSIESPSITLVAPEKAGDIFTGWTGSNGDEPQLTVTIPTGSTGEKIYFANYLLSGRDEIDVQPQLTQSDDLVWVVKNELFVRTTRAGSILRIYSLEGVLQRQHTILQPGETKYKLANGLYIVTLNNTLGQKVMIRP